MAIIEGAVAQVIAKSEWVAIATSGPDGPHLVATWGDYVRALGISEDRLLIPAGRYHKTEENLVRGSPVQLLFASRAVEGNYGPGRGCCLSGRAEVQVSGPQAEAVKKQFPWARGVLVISVRSAQLQL